MFPSRRGGGDRSRAERYRASRTMPGGAATQVRGAGMGKGGGERVGGKPEKSAGGGGEVRGEAGARGAAGGKGLAGKGGEKQGEVVDGRARPERGEEVSSREVDGGRAVGGEAAQGGRVVEDKGEEVEAGLRWKKTTVLAEVSNGTLSMVEVAEQVRKRGGQIAGVRYITPGKFEFTLKEEAHKAVLLDGFRVGDAVVMGRERRKDEAVVSFLGLPVYITDAEIQARLGEWGAKLLSPIKRRKWPGTDWWDGTRYMRVRFGEIVRSLPYSTKFNTLEGVEHFRVVHDGQVRVCRQCL